ncbi:hypothetical protein VPH35_112758 [Triticum aestivum]|uniref:uncharacterized protein n=1 Tax=Triticum aestivum TaxID=4565 RepID=UPI001D019617|nr:uncharacterized protein LOC123138552 [Triticum aestivum]
MEYKPPQYCRCDMKAPRWISWSPKNPGRRYYNCGKALGVDCRYFMSMLLGDLRDVVYRLKDQLRNENDLLNASLSKNKMLDAYVCDLEVKHHGEVVVLKKKIRKLRFCLVVAVLFCHFLLLEMIYIIKK